MYDKLILNVANNLFVGVVITNLLKACDCIPHDLLIAKLSAYGLSSVYCFYIYSYLKYPKRLFDLNKQSEIDKISFWVTQG